MIMPSAIWPSPSCLDIGVHHALEAVVELHLAGNGDAHAGFDLVFQPRLAKACDHKHAGCVHHRDFDQDKVWARPLELRPHGPTPG